MKTLHPSKVISVVCLILVCLIVTAGSAFAASFQEVYKKAKKGDVEPGTTECNTKQQTRKTNRI